MKTKWHVTFECEVWANDETDARNTALLQLIGRAFPAKAKEVVAATASPKANRPSSD